MAAHAFVLHLARARARRENARALLERCGLSGEIWPAVDGAALSAAEHRDVTGADLFAPRYPFALRPGEVGCFLSHRQIWAEIVRRGLDHALVLEDDAALDPDVFPQALRLGLRNVAALGYVQLQTRPPRGPARPIDEEGACRLTRPLLTPLRTSAQIVSRAAAERLLKHSRHIDRPVDTFLQSHWATGLPLGTIWPAGVRAISDALDGSTIQAGAKPMRERLWREGARLLYRRRAARLARQSPAGGGER